MAEGLGEVSCAERAPKGSSNGNEEAEVNLGHDRGEAIIFSPRVWVQVPHDDNAVLDAGWGTILVCLDGGDGEGGERFVDGGKEKLIFLFGNIFPCLGIVVKTKVFFSVCFIPEGLIGGRERCVSLEASRREAAFEVRSGDPVGGGKMVGGGTIR